MSWPYLAVSGLIALSVLLWGLYSLRRKRLLENVPTSKVKGGRAIGGGYLGFVGLMYLAFVYNGIAEVNRRAQMARSMIDVQLKRRADLIPQLVA